MEKQVKGYTRRGKNGKVIHVRPHSRKCDGTACAAGAGKEFAGKSMKKPSAADSPISDEVKRLFSREDWENANDWGDDKATKKIESAIRRFLGKKGYEQYSNYADSTAQKGASFKGDLQAIHQIKSGCTWNGKAFVKGK